MPSVWKKKESVPDMGIHPNRIVSLLLSSRNITNPDAFLSPSFKDFSDSGSIFGCDAVAKAFREVIENKKKVAVIGDYDVDGVMSAAMLKMFFHAFGIKCHVFLPHRIEHGYGLNPTTMDSFLSGCDFSPDLVIACDCGTSSENEIRKLKDSMGVSVIVIDHHQVNDGSFSSSADAIMNWRLDDSGEETCTAGQIFHLARKYAKSYLPSGEKMPKELSAFLPMAAVAIVADVMPIKGDNRIIVRKGLERILTAPFGLIALAERSGMDDKKAMSQKDVAFRMAPKINAAGRIGSPVDSFDLITQEDPIAANAQVETLEKWNKERRAIQKEIEKQAIKQAEDSGFKNGIMIHNKDWHVGVVGIVASRIVEEFNVPAIVVGEIDNKRKGSARSVSGVNVKAVMDTCSDIFEGYGGHEMAAGCTIKEESYEEAASEFDSACARWYELHGRPDNTLFYDMDLEIEDLSPTTARALKDSLYPYCDTTNPEPVFRISNVSASGVNIKEGKDWRRIAFCVKKRGKTSDLRFVTFSDKFDSFLDGCKIDMYFSFGQNTNGEWPPDLEIIDIVRNMDFE